MITTKYYFIVKKFLTALFITLLFCNLANSRGLSFDRQKNLIDNGSISPGMNCNNLSNALGGSNAWSWLMLGNKADKHGHYVLLDVFSKETNKIFYLCEQKRFEHENSDSATDVLKDQDLIKIFFDPAEMFKYIFKVTSEGSAKYILKTLTLSDYNITRPELIIAYAEAQAVQQETSEEEITEVATKPKKKKKKAAKKEKKITKSEDKDPPVIKIADTKTFNSKNYILKGTVKDKSKTVYIEVDGINIDVKNGKFSIRRYSQADEEVEITAIDKWGNTAKKIVKIKIKLKTDVAEKLEKLNPANIREQSSNNRVALIIGIEKYETTVPAAFAKNDAKYFYDYAKLAFGVKESNIKLLLDNNTTRTKTYAALDKWLASKIEKNRTELIIFFAGHGLATSDGKELYLLLRDSDTDNLRRTALSRNEFFTDIEKLKPKSVTMFFDACYSGYSRDPEKKVTLLTAARPIKIMAEEGDAPRNFTIFSASGVEQISSGLKEAKHGIFSYYLMKGLEGKADKNKDRKITNGELRDYLVQNVSRKALELGRSQEPRLAGNANKVLVKY